MTTRRDLLRRAGGAAAAVVTGATSTGGPIATAGPDQIHALIAEQGRLAPIAREARSCADRSLFVARDAFPPVPRLTAAVTPGESRRALSRRGALRRYEAACSAVLDRAGWPALEKAAEEAEAARFALVEQLLAARPTTLAGVLAQVRWRNEWADARKDAADGNTDALFLVGLEESLARLIALRPHRTSRHRIAAG
jgi:hypothetical protein